MCTDESIGKSGGDPHIERGISSAYNENPEREYSASSSDEEYAIGFIVRGDAGEYVTWNCAEAEMYYDIMSGITTADISLLCRTPDRKEHLFANTKKDAPGDRSPCDYCCYLEMCRTQAVEYAE